MTQLVARKKNHYRHSNQPNKQTNKQTNRRQDGGRGGGEGEVIQMTNVWIRKTKKKLFLWNVITIKRCCLDTHERYQMNTKAIDGVNPMVSLTIRFEKYEPASLLAMWCYRIALA